MSYTAREFEKYIKQNRLNFAALTKRQERELGRLYIKFAEYAKLEADKIVNKAGLTYASRQKLIRQLLSKAADLTDDFKGVLDKALLEASNLSIEADRIIMQKYQMRLSGIGVDVDLVGLLQGIPQSSVRLAYKRIWEDGLKLSDRIWTLNRRTTRELERIIMEELAAGRSASSKVLEARLNKLLSPDRRLIKTSLHGRNVSFDAARLLRSERAVACREADRMSALANPGNKGIKWLLSGSERSCQTCIGLASDDSYGLGPGIFPADELPVSPHPQCMCTTYQIVLSSKQLVNNWQEWMSNKASHPEITNWYQGYYRKAA